MKSFQNKSKDVLSFTLGDGTEHIIGPGDKKDLPEGNEFIKSLVAQGILEEVSTAEATAEAKPKKS